jgi:hypothetical protein
MTRDDSRRPAATAYHASLVKSVGNHPGWTPAATPVPARPRRC